MRKYVLLALVFLTSFTVFAQDFSNKGKDFWVTSGWHYGMGNNAPPLMTLSLTSDVNTTFSIEAYGVGVITTGSINANQVTTVNIPSTYFTYIVGSPGGAGNGLFSGKAIHITAVKPIVVYSFTTQAVSSAATLCLPTNVLGIQYYAASSTQISGSSNANNFITIIAVEDNTVIEVIPTQLTAGGWAPNSVNIINLNKGQIYQVLGALSGTSGSDLTGTSIRSVASGSGGCKRISVFSGSGRVWIGGCSNGADNLYQQLYPATTWGRKYLTVPSSGRPMNFYRIIRPAGATSANVKINGVLTAFSNPLENYHQFNNTTPNLIEADTTICVAQLFTSQNCQGNGNPYDPDMVILNPVEQNIADVTLISTGQLQAPAQHYIHVIMKNGGTGISSFRFDGGTIPPTANWVPHPQDPSYSYLYLNSVSQTTHSLKSDSGFNAIAYGYANAETYAYSAGTNVKDIYQRIWVQTTYGIETTPTVCTNSPFRFKVSLPYCADSIRWDLSGLPGPPVPTIDTIRYNTCVPTYPLPGGPDSTTVLNGKTLYWYSLPNVYSFSTIGSYPVSIITYSPNASGCGSEQLIDFDLNVFDPPIASFTTVVPGCYLEAVVATESTPQIPKSTYRQWWEFYDPVTNATTVFTNAPPNPPTSIRFVSHTFTTPGTKRIRHASITTPGCLSDTIVQMITLPDRPFATIVGNNAVCINSVPSVPVTFTGTDGTQEYIFSYNINGGATIISAPSTTGTLTIPAPTNVAGPFTYNLTGVRNATPAGTPCTRAITGQSITVQINPLPNASITGATTVCLNAASPAVTFTGIGGTAPYTFAYSINGTPQTPVVSNAAGIYIINAPTNVAGPFNYIITLVTDASSTLCNTTPNVSALVTVNDLPDAAISGATAVCLNATQPVVTFTGSGGTAPYTFNYTINGVAQPALISNGVGVATVNAPTNVAGPFTYALVNVQEGSPITCLRGGLTGTTVITVNPLPSATIAGAITVCLNSAPPPVTFTGSGGTAPYIFAYSINGTPQTPVVSNAAGIYVINAPTNVAGPFNYTITLVTDASSTLCNSAPNVSTLVTVNDLPNAAISGATTVCLNATQPVVTFTGSGGTAPYTFNYTINGVAQPALISNGAGVATVNAPTNVAGPFTYALVDVQEGSPITCLRGGLTGTTLITVNPLPTAIINGTTEVCLNDASPLVTFTGSGTVAPYTFNYTINGVGQPPLVSNAAGIATMPVPTNVANTFTYNLVSVQDASSTLCLQTITGQQAIIIVHPLPTANFNYTAPSCETRTISFTDASIPNIGTLTGWAWNFGDPGSGGNNISTIQNPTHTFVNAGPYTVTLIATSSKGCSNLPFTKTVNIDNRPQAGFIIPEVCLSDTYAQFLDTSKLTNSVIDRWDWNFGDPGSGPLNVSTLQNPTHSYSAVGTYNVRLIVWNFAKGCRDTITQVLQVNGSFPQAIFSVNNPTTLCANDSIAVVEASTVFPGVITKVEIWFDNLTSGPPAPPDILDNLPFTGKVYKHLYPNFQSPLTRVFQIRYRAYSGGICLDDSIRNITVNAAPLVQFNNMPNSCFLIPPFQITQASEIGGVPGTGTYSGPGVSPTGMFNPQAAGIGTHTILYTYTSSAAGCVDTMSNTITVRDTAHATFSVVLPSCEQVPTMFTNLSTAPASVTLLSTVWNFGDLTGPQTFPISSPITHLYAGPGPYTVTMHTVSTAATGSCLSTDTVAIVNIDANHQITWDAASGSENQPLCVNTSITPIRYTLSGGATNVNFIPSLPPGLTYTVGGTPLTLTISGAPTTPANYSFDIETSGNTCVKDISTVTISVAPDHTISLRSGDTAQSVCINTPIDPIEYDLGGGASGVNISGLPTGVTGTVAGNILTISGTPTNIPATPGFTITTTGNTCLTERRIGQIVVHPYPIPSFTVDKPSYCLPNAIVKFTNGSTTPNGAAMTYLWDFGDGSPTVPFVSPTHWYTSGVGPFTVTLTATSIAVPILNGGLQGCVTALPVPMTSIHPQPKADFVFSKPSVCIGDQITITDATDGRDGIVNEWHWDLGDGTTSVTNPVNHTYADTITYVISMYTVNNFGCNSDTINKLPLVGAPYKPFSVYPYPKVNAGPDKSVLEGGSVQLDATAFANNAQYIWTPNLYLTDAGALRPRVVSPKTDMTYRLTVKGSGGCELSDNVFVKLLKFPVIPNTFTPNNDGRNDKWMISFLNTYPNNRVQIFTRSGNLVFESRGYNTPWDGTLKGKPLPFDTYYYIIEPGNGRDPITGYVTILK